VTDQLEGTGGQSIGRSLRCRRRKYARLVQNGFRILELRRMSEKRGKEREKLGCKPRVIQSQNQKES